MGLLSDRGGAVDRPPTSLPGTAAERELAASAAADTPHIWSEALVRQLSKEHDVWLTTLKQYGQPSTTAASIPPPAACAHGPD